MSSPLQQLTAARIKEFFREPAAVFWVYCFPLLIALALGVAFREKPVEKITLDIREDTGSPGAAAALKERLSVDPRMNVRMVSGDEWKKLIRSGKSDLIVELDGENYTLWDEPNRAESVLARHAFESIVYQQKYQKGPKFEEKRLEETGNRYIDFLMPGLLGMNLMGGGLWGVGFVLVDMRVRKLMKRFLATPMKRRDFMLSVMLSRLIFTIPEVLVLLLFARFFFEVRIQGDILSLVAMIVIGGASFCGLGLLIASRAKTIETVSGLMNLIMLPMWVMSGVFFSAERFPDAVQPLIQVLPLTALNNALRSIILDGKSIFDVATQVLILVSWGGISFAISLRIFRWQ